MNILITGASGFIGTNLLPKVTGPGHEIFTIKADLTDRCGMKKAGSELPRIFDICIHLAGQTDVAASLKDSARDLEVNAFSMINLLSIFRFRRFIYISTGSVYDGHSGPVCASKAIFPAIPYAISKYTAELYLRFFAKTNGNPSEYLILRLFNPYGPHEDPKRFIPRIVRRFGIEKRRKLLVQGSGKAIVDPMYIDDCTDAIIKAVHSKTADTTIDVCRGNPMTIVELAGKAASIFGITPRITCSGASREEVNFYGDPRPQSKLLDFKPAISFSSGMLRYAAFLKKR